jgi:FKBP-type peptidyl-prolyl cis-trans isomerase
MKRFLGLFLVTVSLVSMAACTKKDDTGTQPTQQAQQQQQPQVVEKKAEPPKPAPEVKITDVVVGKGAEAKSGKTVTVHYVGTLPDGKEFDSSVKRKLPFKFKLGAGQVISGWDKGIAGMKVGGKRKLVIPPELAYGAGGAGNVIPPNATLTFDVELLGVS